MMKKLNQDNIDSGIQEEDSLLDSWRFARIKVDPLIESWGEEIKQYSRKERKHRN